MTGSCGCSGVNPEQHVEVSLRDRMAGTYAALVAQRGAYWWYAVQEFLVRQMELRRGGWLYDAGCGVGLYTIPIARQFPQVRIWAVDFSAESLRLLEARAHQEGIRERIRCVCADVTEWTPPEPVEWVVCTEVLQHIPTGELRLRALRRFAESLAPGGELWLVVARHTWSDRRRGIPKELDERDSGGYFRMRFRLAELAVILREAGFRRVRLFGAPVPPVRIGQRLPAAWWGLAHWLQRLPGSGACGRVIVARARPC